MSGKHDTTNEVNAEFQVDTAERVLLNLDTGEGQLRIQMRETAFRDLVVQDINATVGQRKIVRRRMSWEGDSRNIIFLKEDNNSVTLELADVENCPDLGRVTVWHDNNPPTVHIINHKKLEKVRDFNEALVKGEPIDLVGSRRPPKLFPADLYKAARSEQAYGYYRRGRTPAAALELLNPGDPMPAHHWACWSVCLVPACGIVCLFWLIDNPVIASPS